MNTMEFLNEFLVEIDRLNEESGHSFVLTRFDFKDADCNLLEVYSSDLEGAVVLAKTNLNYNWTPFA